MSDTVAGNTSTSATLVEYEPVEGEIDTAGDTDWYRLNLQLGWGYHLVLQGASSEEGTLADPFLSLRDASGGLIDSEDDSFSLGLDAMIYYVPSASGTFFADASAVGGGTGSYTLTLLPDPLDNLGSQARLVEGEQALGFMLDSQDVDWFRVTLAAGVSYQVDMVDAFSGEGTSSFDAFLELRDANGNLLLSDDDSGDGLSARLSFTAASSGTYFVAARTVGSEAGTYLLNLNREGASSDDHPAALSTSGRLVSGGSVTGQLETLGDQDWFRMELTAGVEYRIDLRGSDSGGGSLSDPVIAGIHDAQGNLISGTTNDDFGSGLDSQVSFTPSQSGSYYVSASGFYATGSYTLSLSGSQTADLPANSSTSATLSAGTVLRNRIDTPGDVDWVRVSLTAGQTYVLDLAGDGSQAQALNDPLLLGIYNAAGQLQPNTTNDDYGISLDSRVSFTPSSSGSYYVAASGFGSGTGAYELRLSGSGSSAQDSIGQTTTSAGSGTVGQAVSGEIEFSRDVDWYAFTLQAGQSYRIQVRGLDSGAGTLADPRLASLYDNLGQALAGTGNDDAPGTLDAETVYTASRSGTYYAAVTAGNDGTGSYSLQVSVLSASVTDLPANSSTSGLLTAAAPANGSIEQAGDQDWYRVTLQAGRSYELRLQGSDSGAGTLADPLLAGVFDAQGRALPQTTDDDGGDGLDARVQFTVATSGSYYVAAGAYGDSSGSYRLSLVEQSTDQTDPLLRAILPAYEAVNVPVSRNISLVFDEAVRAGSGHITLSGGGQTRSIAVNDLAQVSFNGDTLTLNPTLDLLPGTYYTLTVDAGAVLDAAGNAYAGLQGSSAYHFQTAAAGQSTQDSWTLMVYVAADNDLEQFAMRDINEMEAVLMPLGINVVVMVDRASGYDRSNGDWTETRYGLIQHDSNTSSIGTAFTSWGELNTGTAATLTRFIDQAVSDHPAANYGLIVWDHGGGLNGTSWDNASNGDNLTLAEYVAALEASVLPHFDFLGFDACLQGMLEQAWDVRALADVLVASQETEPGDGWDYTALLSRLATYTSMTAIDLGSAVVDTYGAFYGAQQGITLSGTRIAALGALGDAIEAFAATAIDAGIRAQLVAAAQRATSIHGGDLDYRDLGDFMREIADLLPGSATATQAQQVISALDAAVFSQTSTVAGTAGLSVYLPLQGLQNDYEMLNFRFLEDTGWGNLLRYMLGEPLQERLQGGDRDNDIRGFEGDDTLSGGGGNDTLDGGSGNDSLDGGSGNDSMIGGSGDDVFIVDSSADLVVEALNGGTDTVYVNRGFTLPANVENVVLTSAATVALYGNGLDNLMVAGAGNNTLYGAGGTDTASYANAASAVTVSLAVSGAQATGGSGSDTLTLIENLTGSGFADRLTGNAGWNLLDGGVGNDTLEGGSGNDTYVVDSASDVIIEAADGALGGTGDWVQTFLASTTLGTGIENGQILRSGAATLYGNAGNNILISGSGNNTLYGSGGVDTASYQNASGAVQVSLALTTAQNTGSSGMDTLQLIESLRGSGFADRLTGNSSWNVMNGGDGADTIDGGDGGDLMAGGFGTAPDGAADVFVFSTTLDARRNVDRIVSFEANGLDKIQLDPRIFAALGAGLDAGELRVGTRALDADDFILFDPTTGVLRYDADGNGAGASVVFAKLDGMLGQLDSGDFVVRPGGGG